MFQVFSVKTLQCNDFFSEDKLTKIFFKRFLTEGLTWDCSKDFISDLCSGTKLEIDSRGEMPFLRLWKNV